MKKPVLLTFLFLATTCSYKTSAWADAANDPAVQPDKALQSGENTVQKNEKSEKSYVELETIITNKPVNPHLDDQPSETGLDKEKPAVDAGNEKATTESEVAKSPAEGITGKANEGILSEQKAEVPEDSNEELQVTPVKDPLQSYNRAIFVFNDKAYYYVFKPIYRGYKKVVPEKARVSVRNFYTNIKTPVRLFNCLFQGKFKGAGTEGLRFLVNSTIGLAGFFDPANSQFHLKRQEEDTGQTLARHQVKSGVYIVWPFLGPSTVRDTFGYVGDSALNPLTWISYFFLAPIEGFGTYAYDTVNEGSIDVGDTYEKITKPAIDPYIALQDAYIQNRKKKIQE